MTANNHCAHVTRFLEVTLEKLEDAGEETTFKLLGKVLVYMVAELPQA